MKSLNRIYVLSSLTMALGAFSLPSAFAQAKVDVSAPDSDEELRRVFSEVLDARKSCPSPETLGEYKEGFKKSASSKADSAKKYSEEFQKQIDLVYAKRNSLIGAESAYSYSNNLAVTATSIALKEFSKLFIGLKQVDPSSPNIVGVPNLYMPLFGALIIYSGQREYFYEGLNKLKSQYGISSFAELQTNPKAVVAQHPTNPLFWILTPQFKKDFLKFFGGKKENPKKGGDQFVTMGTDDFDAINLGFLDWLLDLPENRDLVLKEEALRKAKVELAQEEAKLEKMQSEGVEMAKVKMESDALVGQSKQFADCMRLREEAEKALKDAKASAALAAEKFKRATEGSQRLKEAAPDGSVRKGF